MEYLLIIILILVMSALSAATIKKPGFLGKRHAPPRTGMSDIRRAYKRAVNAARNQPLYPPPPPLEAPDVPLTDVPLTPVSADADAPSEGRMPTEPVAPTVTESYTGLNEEELVRPMAVESVVPLAGIRPDAYFTGGEKTAPVSKGPAPKAARIPLFKDQQEIVRAFIYAEVLPRRAYPRRFR